MELRTLGSSDLQLTPVGLGTWAMGGGDWKASWGPQDDQASVDTVHAALDAGINWIDTAAVYGLGHAETVVGRALKETARRPLIATKCGRVWPEGVRDQIHGRLTADSVRAECEASLRRLGVDTIDLYQIHWPDPDDQIEEAWQAIAGLIEAGKVRHAGVSNFSVAQLQRAQAVAPVVSLQPRYNLLQRELEHGVLPFCRQQNIGVVGYSSMAKGLLTGKVTSGWVAALPADDHRRGEELYQPDALEALAPKLAALRDLAVGHKVSRVEIALAWSFHQPGLTSAIGGARRPEQVSPLAAAMHVRLSADDLQMLDALFPLAADAVAPAARK